MAEGETPDRLGGRSQTLPEARKATNRLLAAAQDNAGEDACPDIVEQLEMIEEAPNPEELSQAVQFLLQRSHQAHPELPEIELYHAGGKLAARVVDQTGETWCNASPENHDEKVTPRLILSF